MPLPFRRELPAQSASAGISSSARPEAAMPKSATEKHGSEMYPELVRRSAPLHTADDRKSSCSVTSAGRSAWARPILGMLRLRDCGTIDDISLTTSFFSRHYPGQRPEILWIGCELHLHLLVMASNGKR